MYNFDSIIDNYINGNIGDMKHQIDRSPSLFSKWLYENEEFDLKFKLDLLTKYLTVS